MQFTQSHSAVRTSDSKTLQPISSGSNLTQRQHILTEPRSVLYEFIWDVTPCIWQDFTDVSEERVASTFWIEEWTKQATSNKQPKRY
jgi:hypothetical protein